MTTRKLNRVGVTAPKASAGHDGAGKPRAAKSKPAAGSLLTEKAKTRRPASAQRPLAFSKMLGRYVDAGWMQAENARIEIAQRERKVQLARLAELGGGISDFAQGAVVRYAPMLSWPSDTERTARIDTHVSQGTAFRAWCQLATPQSEVTRDALAVWHPLVLNHLLRLDASPPQSQLSTERELREASARHEQWRSAVSTLELAQREVRTFEGRLMGLSSTAAALREVMHRRTSGEWPTSRMMEADDHTRERARTLEEASRIVDGLHSDARSARDSAKSHLERVQAERAKVTGATEWSADQSTRVGRRVATLVDMLRRAERQKWSWRRLAELVRASLLDWTKCPCPSLASNDQSTVEAWLKTRYRREGARRQRLGLRVAEVYPWLAAG